MEDFKHLYRDSEPIQNPTGTWHNGKNMLFRKGWRSPRNEDGFDFSYLVPGVTIGAIHTNTEVVYFLKGSNGTDEIGVVDIATNTYRTVIRSNLFNFQLDCPIEGIFIYNSRNELIVAFSDGIKENSNRPYVINLDNVPIELNNDGTLVNNSQFTRLLMFPDRQEATLTPSILTTGSFEHGDVYVTYTYVTDNDVSLPYFSSSIHLHLASINIDNNAITRRGFQLDFTDLDTDFNQIRIGLVFRTETNTLLAYESVVFNYTGSTFSTSFTSLSGLTSTTPEAIIVNPLVINKFETITKTDTQAFIGNFTTREDIQFQKYANMLNLVPVRHTDTNNLYGSLHPDEVYAFYIELQYLDGSYSNAFHIPNLTVGANETDALTATQISDFNLSWVGSQFRQFHIFNQATFDNRFGYWENIETYPNIDDFNSTIDYDGNALTGQDLRGTPIKYHRAPDIESLYLDTVNNYPTRTTDRSNIKIGVRLTNFETIVPASVRSQIQGYRLSIVRRNNTNNLVLGNWLLFRRDSFLASTNNITYESAFARDNRDTNLNDNILTNFRAYNPELLSVRPALTPTFIKINYFLGAPTSGIAPFDPILNTPDIPRVIPNEHKYAECGNPLVYVPGDNLASNTSTSETAANLDFASSYGLTLGELVVGNQFYFGFNSIAFNLQLNLYSGFRSTDLIVVGKTQNLTNNIDFLGGDVYYSSLNLEIYQLRFIELNVGDFRVRNTIRRFRFTSLFSALNDVIMENISTLPDNEDTEVFPQSAQDTLELNQRIYDYNFRGVNTNAVVNDLATIITADLINEQIDRFPFRVQRGIVITNETINERALRTFPVESYYEMPTDKGEIVALRGVNRNLYIQQRFSLFLAQIKDTLRTGEGLAFIGFGDIFDRPPVEIVKDSKGYIGSSSKFACIIIRGRYITVHQDNGQIFMVSDGVNEISARGNKTWFWNNWAINSNFVKTVNGETRSVDNPYVSVGHHVTYDKEYNRLLFFKKDYELVDPNAVTGGTLTFDGEFYRLASDNSIVDFNNTTHLRNLSRTLSYDLDSNEWLFEHDYHPNIAFYTVGDIFSGINNLETMAFNVYRHNSKFNKGNFYGVQYQSYFEAIFNLRLQYTKVYQSLMWVTTVERPDGGIESFETVDAIMLYNDYQCSGIVDVDDNGIINRNSEWYFNAFRDLQINGNLPVINENGDIISSNINNSKNWFDKSIFISKFIVVRLIMNNTTNNTVHIHKINVKSVINK